MSSSLVEVSSLEPDDVDISSNLSRPILGTTSEWSDCPTLAESRLVHSSPDISQEDFDSESGKREYDFTSHNIFDGLVDLFHMNLLM